MVEGWKRLVWPLTVCWVLRKPDVGLGVAAAASGWICWGCEVWRCVEACTQENPLDAGVGGVKGQK